MITHLRISCDHCQRMLKVPVEYLNRRVICNHCDHPFLARPDDREHPYSPLRFAIATSHPVDERVLAGLLPSETDGAELGGAEAPSGPPASRRSGPAAPSSATPHARSAEEELRAEIDRLRVELELRGDQAGALSRLEADLESLRAESEELRHKLAERESQAEASTRLVAQLEKFRADRDHLRDTVKILQADLVNRAADAEAREARYRSDVNALGEAAASESRTLQAEINALREQLEVLVRGQEQLATRHGETLAERDRIAHESGRTSALLAEATSRIETLQREAESLRGLGERLRSDLEASNRLADAFRHEQDRYQAEAAALRDEIEQQRLRREQERLAQQEALARLKVSLAERLAARAAARAASASTDPIADQGLDATGQPAAAVVEASEPEFTEPDAPDAGESAGAETSGTPDDQFRALRSHLRDLRDAELREKANHPPLVSRLARMIRPDGSKP